MYTSLLHSSASFANNLRGSVNRPAQHPLFGKHNSGSSRRSESHQNQDVFVGTEEQIDAREQLLEQLADNVEDVGNRLEAARAAGNEQRRLELAIQYQRALRALHTTEATTTADRQELEAHYRLYK